MQVEQVVPTIDHCDNKKVLNLEKNLVFHERFNHVEAHCHYIWQLVENGEIELQYSPSQEKIADILTKCLGLDKFVNFRDKLGVLSSMTINVGC